LGADQVMRRVFGPSGQKALKREAAQSPKSKKKAR
jgi:hypothetical protein